MRHIYRTLLLTLRAATSKDALSVAKVHYKLRVASGLNLSWYGNMLWDMEENFSTE